MRNKQVQSQTLLCHDDADFNTKTHKINNVLLIEKKNKISKKITYIKFKKKIDTIKKKLNLLIDKLKKKNKTIHGYAASTKGNVLLQYFNLDNSKIDFISDKNPAKTNLFTPGTNIRIISENESRKKAPDFYIVLAWHFKKEILLREKKLRKRGTKFIFPLPKIKVI